jgi:hypothetical protein
MHSSSSRTKSTLEPEKSHMLSKSLKYRKYVTYWEAAYEATIVDHFMLEDPQIEQLHYAERTGFPR